MILPHKSFIGKVFSDKKPLRAKIKAKRGRWVYEGGRYLEL